MLRTVKFEARAGRDVRLEEGETRKGEREDEVDEQPGRRAR